MKRKSQVIALLLIPSMLCSCSEFLDWRDEFTNFTTYGTGTCSTSHSYYDKIGVITLYTEYHFNSKGRVRLSDGTYLTCVTPSPRNLKEGTRVRIGRFDKVRNAYVVTTL